MTLHICFYFVKPHSFAVGILSMECCSSCFGPLSIWWLWRDCCCCCFFSWGSTFSSCMFSLLLCFLWCCLEQSAEEEDNECFLSYSFTFFILLFSTIVVLLLFSFQAFNQMLQSIQEGELLLVLMARMEKRRRGKTLVSLSRGQCCVCCFVMWCVDWLIVCLFVAQQIFSFFWHSASSFLSFLFFFPLVLSLFFLLLPLLLFFSFCILS